ncbi:hypothetical protein FGE12_28530 [Aggregicoccus sp. 17bor-14]|uniref:hypothetical protein n=1 Tax=Myxococcaceae TaxID=31 RepID=UPI00129C2E26|nr:MULTISPECIES: hypothetical protein [Myxococcaceae]MBF5046395.1 hypothetical protein [Simulacricoccus sp. 17bor-14]MRI92115.1 hypothetical protein [Aggregicoccus sp. 17bor-14]
MNPYRIYFPPAALRGLRALPAQLQQEVRLHLENVATLAAFRRPSELRNLYSEPDACFAAHVSTARALFTIDADLRTLYVKRVEASPAAA